MQTFNYAVFVTTTFGNQWGTSVSTTVIPARGEAHAREMADQINNTNEPSGSYLVNRAHVIGS